MIYNLSSGLPVIGYMSCLFVIAIKREATIMISIVMMVMINPAITLAIGAFARTIGQLLSEKFPQLYKFHRLARLFTYSINGHFTLVAALTIYMYDMWYSLQKRAEFAPTGDLYDKCTCDVLKARNQVCINKKSEYSFQNEFLLVPLQTMLLTFLIISVICHMIQAFFFHLPAPIPLYQFIDGKEDKEDKEDKIEKGTGSECEMKNLCVQPVARPNESKAVIGNMSTIIKLACCAITMAFFVGLAGVPFYAFENSISAMNGETFIQDRYLLMRIVQKSFNVRI